MDVPISPGQKGGVKRSILLPSLLALNAAVAAEPELRIRLIDEVNLDTQDRETVRSKAREILARAGVSSIWLDCPAKPSPETPQGCLDALSATDLIIRILPRTMIGHDNGLGSSVANRDGGVYGLIYYPKVEQTAQTVGVPVPVLLALAAVHEIGHLVLGNQAHWPAGVMHPRWGRKEVADMTAMNHYFNRTQSKQLQARLLTRELPR
jgi:hypothetical protein